MFQGRMGNAVCNAEWNYCVYWVKGDQVIIPVLNSHPSLLSPPFPLKPSRSSRRTIAVVLWPACRRGCGEIEEDGWWLHDSTVVSIRSSRTLINWHHFSLILHKLYCGSQVGAVAVLSPGVRYIQIPNPSSPSSAAIRYKLIHIPVMLLNIQYFPCVVALWAYVWSTWKDCGIQSTFQVSV